MQPARVVGLLCRDRDLGRRRLGRIVIPGPASYSSRVGSHPARSDDSLPAMADIEQFVVPFKVALEFESGLTVAGATPADAEATVLAVLGSLRLVSDDGHGSIIPLDGDLSVSDCQMLEPQKVEGGTEGVAARGDRSLAREPGTEEEPGAG